MRTIDETRDQEQERLALRFLYIGHLLMGGGRDSNGRDSIHSRQYEQLSRESELIACRLHVLDRLDLAARNRPSVSREYLPARAKSRAAPVNRLPK
jgi:hypothetical protein